MFSGFMPHRREFFDLLATQSDRVVASANATLRVINSLGGNNEEEIALLVREVDSNKKSGDKIKADMIALLHKSFITPLNRDEIHSLTLELDKVLGALRNVANAVNMYNIQQSTPEARELAAHSADSCMRLGRAVVALGEKERRREAVVLCQEIDEIETRADKVLKKAITRLFQDGSDIWAAMKLREFYVLQEKVLDACQEAAKTIEEILIEHS